MMKKKITRRQFIKRVAAGSVATMAATTGIAGILAAHRAPAYAQGTELHIVRWNDFIAEADAVLKRQAVEASKELGAKIIFDFINVGDLQPRITAAIQSGSGADISQLLWNWAPLYANALVAVPDVAGPIGNSQGGFYDIFNYTAKVGGEWVSVPHGVGGFFPNYRRSQYAEIGLKEFPKTWDALREAGKKLKEKGRPIGQSLGHGMDSTTFTYPLLWSFGGAEVDETGKKVVLNSKNTLESVKFMKAFWKEACDESGLAWNDTSNNRAFLAGELSTTFNGMSIYLTAKRQSDKVRDENNKPLFLDIDHALMPGGPGGQFHLNTPFQHGIMKYSKNQNLAKAFLKWLHQTKNYEQWFVANEGYSMGPTKGWANNPMWSKIDKVMLVMRDAVNMSRMMGYQGPSSAKATEAHTKFIIVDMYAKAVMGMTAEDAVKWAEGELKKIYEA